MEFKLYYFMLNREIGPMNNKKVYFYLEYVKVFDMLLQFKYFHKIYFATKVKVAGFKSKLYNYFKQV